MNLQKKSKWTLAIILILFIISFSTYKYIYKPHETIESLSIDYKGTSNNFSTKATTNPNKWLNKTVELSGKITSTDSKGITLSSNIYCQFKNTKELNSLQKNQSITIKGTVIGYDNLLDELKINQCIIKNN